MGTALALNLLAQALTQAQQYQSLIALAKAQNRDVRLEDIQALQKADDIQRAALQAEIERQTKTMKA